MVDLEPRGACYWIDHYVVGTNDMAAWSDWAVNAIGLTRQPLIGLTTSHAKKNVKITCFLWWKGGSCRIGAFLQPEIFPPAKALARIFRAAVFTFTRKTWTGHLLRLDQHKIPHTDPVPDRGRGRRRYGHLFC